MTIPHLILAYVTSDLSCRFLIARHLENFLVRKMLDVVLAALDTAVGTGFSLRFLKTVSEP
jgi:hypothetical protein